MVVVATDQGDPPLTSNVTISVYILDENDESPRFVEPAIPRFTVQEGRPAGTFLGTVVAVDDDKVGTENSTVTYNITGGSGLGYFTVDRVSGNVTLVAAINLNETSGTTLSFEIIIAASDQGVPPRTTEQNFTIEVLDADDNEPEFEREEYEFDIDEGNDPGAFIGRVIAVDLDPHNRSIGYDIEANITLFRINASSGEIFANGIVFNRSNHESTYTIYAVTYFQDSPGDIHDRAKVTITINDVNEFGVVIVNFNSTIFIEENTPMNEAVGKVDAIDLDPDSELAYFLTIRQDVLGIEQDTGTIYIAKGIDREDETLFRPDNNQCPPNTEIFYSCLTFNILVEDSNNLNNFFLSTARASGILYVRDLDDTPPQFTEEVYSTSVNESLPVDTSVMNLDIQAFDSDIDVLVRYSIPPSENVTSFAFRSELSRVMIVAEPLNYERTQTYNFTIVATDSGGNNGTARVVIAIEDVNDNRPVFDEAVYSTTIPEDLNVNSVVEVVHATDRDSENNRDITYRIAAGNDGYTFKIDEIDGIIRLNVSLDREERSMYLLTIEAVDQGIPAQNGTALVNITVSDISDHPPYFTRTQYFGFVEENAVPGDPVWNGSITSGQELVLEVIDPDVNSVVTILSFPPPEFSVNPLTGAVTVGTVLDHDTQPEHNFIAVAHDELFRFSEPVQVSIKVLPINEHSPVFQQEIFDVSVMENSQENEVIVTVVADDLDFGDIVEYAIETDFNVSELEFPEPTSAIGMGSGDNILYIDEDPAMNRTFPFEINNSTGEVSLVTILDFEVKQMWTFTVVATDLGGRQDNATVEVTVLDQNDNSPRFTDHYYQIEIVENATVSSSNPVSTAISATDLDSVSQNHLRYYILRGSTGVFEINHMTGDLYLVGTLNPREVYRLDLLVSDGMREDTAVAVVTVADINDNRPVFEFPEYTAYLPENATRNTIVLTVVANDNDLSDFGEVYYELISGDTNLFLINQFTGDIITNNTEPFDFESRITYQLEVKAYDGGNPRRCSTVNVTIILVDVNDDIPQFTQTQFFVNVKESEEIGNSVFQLTVDDQDSGINKEVVYEILTVNSSFSVDPETGVLSVASELDYDPPAMQRMIELDILATDRGNPPLSSNGTLIVNITDVNDNAPFFMDALSEVFVDENITVNSTAFTVQAFDIDSGENSRLTYEVVTTLPLECQARYTIRAFTGDLILSQSLDAEDRSQPCTMIIEATDNGVPQRSTQATFLVTVSDINENPPMFVPESLVGSVPENSLNGTYVLTVRTIDPDQNPVMYFAVGGATDLFQIDRVTGNVTVSYGAVLDRERTSQYKLEIEARENGVPVLSSVANATITLEDVNDSPPTFARGVYYIDLRENQPVSDTFEVIGAIDLDTFPNHLIYTFLPNSENETDYGIFVVDRNTGGLQVSGRLDYDQTDNHFFFLRVQVNDTVATDIARVNIRILESNDESPIFTNLPAEINLREDAGDGAVVFQANATDLDLGVNGEVIYILVEGQYSDKFRIDDETGEIFVNGDRQFDFESGVRTIILTVRAMDNAGANVTEDNDAPQGSGIFSGYGGFDANTSLISPDDPPMFTDRSLTVQIVDVNDNSPQFTMTEYSSIIIEHPAPIILRVTTVLALDADEPGTNNSAVRYTLRGEGADRFKINAITGEIDTNPPIDRETNPNFLINVVAFDLGTPSRNSSADLFVLVLGLDDERPVFTRPLYTGEVEENSLRGTSVLTVLAIDLDSPASNATNVTHVTYNLFDTTHFMVNATTGEIQTTGTEIDREAVQHFNLTVQARDNEGQTDISSVFITVVDRNDEAPIFPEPKSYSFNISENLPLDAVLVRVEAIDPDIGSNAIARYSLAVADGREGIFAVDSVEGNVFVSTPLCFSDSRTQSYTLIVTAVDSLDASLNDTATIAVNVYKENAHIPEFAQPSYVSRLNKEAENGTVVINTLRTIDLDTCSMYRTPVYEIIDGNVNNTFVIDPLSGVITLTRDLTDDDLSFTLRVRANETGNFHLISYSIEVDVIVLIGQLLPVSIAIENGLTVATISRDSQFEYQQDVWLFNGGSALGPPPIVHYFLGNLEVEKEVEVEPASAVSVTAYLAQDTIYPEPGYILVGLQVRGGGYEVANANRTSVYVRIENDIGETVTETCVTEPPASTCVVHAPIPRDWFFNSQSNQTANVYYGIQSQSETELGPVTLVPLVNCSNALSDGVRVILPRGVVFPDDIFTVSVQAATAQGIRSYHLIFELSDGLEALDVEAPSHYSVQWASSEGKLSISALNTEVSPLTFQEVLSITLYVRENATVVPDEPLRADCTVLYMIDGTGYQVLSEEPAGHVGFNEDGSCDSTKGEILVKPHTIVGVFAYANTSSILNTAAISGDESQTPITTVGLLNSGYFTDYVYGVTCESGDPSILKVSEDCAYVFVNGTESVGSEDTRIFLTWYDSVHNLSRQVEIPFRVWFPTNMVVIAANTELSQIASIRNVSPTGSCEEVYESTEIEVEVVFVAGDSQQSAVVPHQSAVVTPLVLDLVYSGDEGVLKMEVDSTRYTIKAVGVSTGSSSIGINNFRSEVTPATINVTSGTVSVNGFNFNVHTQLVPSSLRVSTAGDPFTDTAVVSLETEPRYLNTQVDILTEAVLDNGRNFELSESHGLELQSSNPEILQESDNPTVFFVRGTGAGRFLGASLRGLCYTPATNIAPPELDFQLDSIDRLIVSVETDVLTLSAYTDVLNLPSQTEIQVELVHLDGTQVPVNDDPRVQFDTLPQLVFNNGIVEAVQGSGEVEFTLTYLLQGTAYEGSGSVTIVSITELQLSARLYPYYTGAAYTNSPVVRRYASTSEYQRLQLRLTAVLSDNSTMDVSDYLESNSTEITLNVNATRSGSVLVPQGPGNGTVVVDFRGVQAVIEVTVLDSEVAATSIEAFGLPLVNGTLFGNHGMMIVPILTLGFSDGSLYPNFLTPSGPALPNLISFSSNSTANLPVDTETGIVEVLYNTWQDAVSLTATLYVLNGTDSLTLPFSVDLQPRAGEVDVEGLSQNLPTGGNVEVPLYVNSEGSELGVVEIEAHFNSSSWRILSISLGGDLEYVATNFQYSQVEDGKYRIGVVLGSALSGSPRVHVATLMFEILTNEGQYFNVLVNTLNTVSEEYSPIGEPTPRYSIPASLTVPPNANLTTLPRCNDPPCMSGTCYDLRGYVPAGDANGDCVFDIVDALYVQEAIPFVPIAPEDYHAFLTPGQLVALDADWNGRVDHQDVAFLVGARLGLHALVPNINIRSIEAQFSDCRLTVFVELQEQTGLSPDDAFVYFGLFHRNSSFQTQYENTTLSIGYKLDPVDRPNGAFGGWLLPDNINSTYTIQTNPGIIAQEDLGFVLVYGSSISNRTTVLTGYPTRSLQYGSLQATFPNGVSITLDPFNPQQLFDNSFPAELCYNDHSPMITSPAVGRLVLNRREDTVINTTLATVAAEDQDDGPAGDVAYKLADVSQPGTLGIDPITGVLFIAGTLDREAYAEVTGSIVAEDQGPHVFTRRTDELPFTLDVTDFNDNPPVADQLVYTANISEGVTVPVDGESISVFEFGGDDRDVDASNRVIGAVVVSAGDDPENPRFSVTASNVGGTRFTGHLTLVRSLDRETNDTYNLTIMISDAGSPPQTSEFTILVTVIDANDERPIFTSPDIATVRENQPAGTSVLNVTAFDIDLGANMEFTYEINSVFEANDLGHTTNNPVHLPGYFTINATTGLLATAQELDREGIHSFRITVLAVEVGIEKGEAFDSIWVMVCEENDNHPTFPQFEYTAYMMENAPMERSVTQLVAYDRDLGNFCPDDDMRSNNITYSLLTNNVPFVIDPDTGIVSVSGSLDYEKITNYTVIVRVVDGGNPILSNLNVTSLTIFIRDVNDNPPVLSNDSYSDFTVENSSIGRVVIDQISATDQDSGDNKIIRFNLTGEGSEDFEIDPETGVIRIAMLLDREDRPEYNLTVIAYNPGDPTFNDTALVNIKVLDIADEPPDFDQSSYYAEVSENTPVGDVVLSVFAEDSDIVFNRTIVYDFPGQAPELFTIHRLSGEITTTKLLCTDSNVSYTFTVRAFDNPAGTLIFSTVVNVTILVYDDNSFDPEFTRQEYASVLPSDVRAGVSVITVAATDGDVCSPPFIYSLSSTHFAIDNATGVITTTSMVESATDNFYELTVRVLDSGTPNPRTGMAIVYVLLGETVPIDVSTTIGYPIGTVQASPPSYQQRFDYLYKLSRFDTDGTAQAIFGANQLQSSQAFDVTLLPATRLSVLLLTTTVYYSAPRVQVAIQGLDEFGSTAIDDTEVYIIAQYGSEGQNASAIIDRRPDSLSLRLPDSWFSFPSNESRVVSLSYVIVGQPSSPLNQSVTLVPRPDYSSSCTGDNPLVVIDLPVHTLYEQEQVEAPILAYHGSSVLSAVSLNCSLPQTGLDFSYPFVTAQSSWDMFYELGESETSIAVSAIRNSYSVPTIGNFESFLSLHLQVNEVLSDNATVECTLLSAVDTVGNFDLYELVVSDRAGCRSDGGTLHLSKNVLFGAFATSDQTVVFNDAVLNGQFRPVYPQVVGVFLSTEPKFYFSQLFASEGGTSCWSENSDVLKAEMQFRDCRVFADGTETAGSDALDVSFSVSSFQTNSVTGDFIVAPDIFPVSVSFQVWFPHTPISLWAVDSELNLMEGWRSEDYRSSCGQAYQRTSLRATATYTNTKENATVSVEHLLSFRSNQEPQFIAIDGTEVVGIAETNTTTIVAFHPTSNDVIGSTVVSILPSPVRAVELDVIHSTELTLSLPEVIPYKGSDPFRFQLNPYLQFETQTAHLVTTAVFSDGTRYRLPPSPGLSYASLNTTIIEVTGSEFTALNRGEGELLEVSFSGCDGEAVITELSYLNINLSEPMIRIDVVPDLTLVRMDDPAASLTQNFTTSVSVTASLVYAVGGETIELDITESAEFALSPGGILVMTNGQDAKIIEPLLSYNGSAAAVNLVVSYKSYQAVTTVLNVGRTIGFSATAQPRFNITHDDLRTIGNTGEYQQAQIVTQLDVEGPLVTSVIDLTADPALQYEVMSPNPNYASISSSGMITPRLPGSIVIETSFGRLVSTLSIEVTNLEVVDVASIDRLELSTGMTLSGLPDTVSAIISASLTLSDGEYYEEFYNQVDGGQLVPGLLVAVSNNRDVFLVDTATGRLTIRDNAPSTVSLSVTANDDIRRQRVLEFYANLQPQIGELDLGQVDGPPVPPVALETDFVVPLWMNVEEGASLGAIEVAIAYSGSLIELHRVSQGTGIGSSDLFGSSGGEFMGFSHLGIILQGELSAGLVHLADLHFMARSDAGVAAIRAQIVTLLNRANEPLATPESAAAYVGVVVGDVELHLQPDIEVPVDEYLTSSFETTPECSGGKETGDVDGDCIFSFADIAYLNLNECTEDQDADFDRNGIACSQSDLLYLMRAYFRLVAFVQAVEITPVNVTDCFLSIDVTVVTKGDEVPDAGRTSVYVLLVHRDADFQAAVDATVPTTDFGVPVDIVGDLPASTNAGLFQARLSDGVYRLVLNTHISKTNVGLVLLQIHTDAYGGLDEYRVNPMASADTIPQQFPEYVNVSIRPQGFTLPIQTPLGFNPFETFDQTFSSPDCINENGPTFFPNTTVVEVYENLENGSIVAVVFANDSDAGPNAQVVYSFDSSRVTQNVLNTFKINETSGELSLIMILDRETTNEYFFGVRARDQGIQFALGGFGEVRIIVLDVNDNPPQFDRPYYITDPVAENLFAPNETHVVFRVTAMDRDIGENGTIRYSLLDSYEFGINNETGEIFIASPLDYETRVQYNLTVVAEDGGTPPLNGTAVVVVKLEPVNDNSPQCSPTERTTILLEDAFSGTLVTRINASDNDDGADHAVLTFILYPPSADFDVRKIDDTTAEIYTTSEGFDRVLVPEIVLTVLVSDVDGRNCTITVTVIIGEPASLDFRTEQLGAGFLLEPPSLRRTLDGFDQRIGFFSNSREQGTIIASLSDAQVTSQFERQSVVPDSFEIVLQNPRVWFDNPTVRAVVQLRDRFFNTRVFNSNIALTAIGSLGNKTGPICELVQANGICVLSVDLVDIVQETSETNETISFELQWEGMPDPIPLPATAIFHPKPILAVPDNNLVVQVPSYSLHPNEDFMVWVGAAPDTSILGFEVELETPANVVLGSVTSMPGWSCEATSVAPRTLYICLKVSDGYPIDVESSIQYYFSIEANVGSSTSPNVITATTTYVRFASGSVISSRQPSIVIDRDGLREDGQARLYIDPVTTRGILAWADRPELINTVPLNGNAVTTSITVVAVTNDPNAPYKVVSTDLYCTSNASILSNCSTIELTSTSVGSEETLVNINHNNFTFDLPVRVWHPVSVQLSVPDQVLNLVPGWYDCPSINGQYQQTRATVTAQFSTGLQNSPLVDVTEYVTLVSGHPDIVSVTGRYLKGESAGLVNISIGGYTPETAVQIEVSNSTVYPVFGFPTVFTSISVSTTPVTYTSDSEVVATATIAQTFNDIGIEGYPETTVYFTDGARYSVPSNELQVVSLNPEVAVYNVTRRAIVARGPGTASVSVNWVNLCSPSTVIMSGIAEVVVTVPVVVPERIELQLSSPAVTGTTRGIVPPSIPSSSEVTVILHYNDTSTENVTNEITINTSASLQFIVATSTIIATPGTSSTSGSVVADYTVDGLILSDSTTVSIVHVQELLTTIEPYPNPSNVAPSTSITLMRIANTTHWQQACLVTQVLLSDGSREQLVNVQYTDPSGGPDISAAGIVVPMDGQIGTFAVTGSLGALQSNGVTITVEDLVVTVELIQLELRDLDSEIMKQVVANISFVDGTELHDVLTTPEFADLLTFEFDPEGVATIDANILTITDSHYDLVTLIARPSDSNLVAPDSDPVSFTANLPPQQVGDVDLGQELGIPQPPVSAGETFTVDVRVDIGNNSGVGAMDVVLEYDSNTLEYVSANVAGFSAIRARSPVGQLQLVTLDVPSTTSTPSIAEVTFRVQDDAVGGTTGITSFLKVLTNETFAIIGSRETSRTGNLTVYIASGISKRAISRHARAPVRDRAQRTTASLGDVNEDGLFDIQDAAFVGRALFDPTFVLSAAQEFQADADRDGQITFSDLSYLIQAAAGNLPFLEYWNISDVSPSQDCRLEFSVRLAGGPGSNFTFLFVVLSHPDFGDLLNVSQVEVGERVTFDDGTSGIFEAYPVDSDANEYRLSLYTPIDFQTENYGLSIVLFTTDHDYDTAPERHINFIRQRTSTTVGSGTLVPEISGVNLESSRASSAQISGVAIGDPNGFSPLDTSTNDQRSDYCSFDGSTVQVLVPESQELHQTFYTVSAAEPGFPSSGEEYELTSASSVFNLASSGELSLISTLDFDQGQRTYTIEVNASVPSLSRNIGVVIVNITVLDVNDNDPLFIGGPFTASIREDEDVGYEVEILSASDLDSGVNGMFTFAISTDSDPDMQFSIEMIGEAAGNLTIAKRLDREKISTYELIIIATDRGEMARSSNTTVSVTVLDVNDNTPQFDQLDYTVIVPENASIGIIPDLVIVVTDLDEGENGNVTVELLNTSTVPFALTQNGSRSQLSVTGELNREAVALYQLIIRASDNGSPQQLTNTTSVTIIISDINDNVPTFSTDNPMMVIVEEDSPTGMVIEQIIATDNDTDANGEIRYRLGEDGTPFAIDPVSGEVSISKTLDINQEHQYNLTIIASDQGIIPRSSEWPLTVNIIEGQVVSFNAGTSGYTVGTYTRTGVRTYSQAMGYLFGEQIGTPATATGGINTATEGEFDIVEIPNFGDEAVALRAAVLQEDVKHTLRTVTVFLQALDLRNTIPEPTFVRVRIVASQDLSGPMTQVDTLCTTSPVLGYCIAQATLPDEWFNRGQAGPSGRFVSVYAALASAPEDENGELLQALEVEHSPTYEEDFVTQTNPIALIVPTHTIFPSQQFTAEVYIVSPIDTPYTRVEFDVISDLGTLNAIGYDEQQWDCGK